MNDFRDRALCRGVDTDVFFPTADPWQKPKLYESQAAEAKSICALCPVRRECLDIADGMAIPFGVFGGLTPEERRLRRDRDAGRSLTRRPAELESTSPARG